MKKLELYIKEELNKLPSHIKSDLNKLVQNYKENNLELNLVGGFVRDLIYNYYYPKNKVSIENADLDFSTNAELEQTKVMFPKRIENNNGEKHGTITVILNDNYEITRYRLDISTDGRNATIKFSNNCKDDLSRRDFNFNAIAYDLINNKLIDPFNGVDDIINKKINFVGNTKTRILEDHLRAIRYFRFKLKYGFEINEEDIYIILENFDSNVLSIERIYMELNKIMKLENIGLEDITYLNQLQLFKRFKNKENNEYLKLFEKNNKFINFDRINEFIILNNLLKKQSYISLILFINFLEKHSTMNETVSLLKLQKRDLKKIQLFQKFDKILCKFLLVNNSDTFIKEEVDFNIFLILKVKNFMFKYFKNELNLLWNKYMSSSSFENNKLIEEYMIYSYTLFQLNNINNIYLYTQKEDINKTIFNFKLEYKKNEVEDIKNLINIDDLKELKINKEHYSKAFEYSQLLLISNKSKKEIISKLKNNYTNDYINYSDLLYHQISFH